ncbi:MAG: ABC transporter ATP-binding protein [Flavobacteriales bacterium]
MLEAKQITFSYDALNEFSFPDFTCAEGEKKLILGGSGTGKTTYLHLLTGLLRPNSGSITLNGTNIATLSSKELDQFRGKHIGLVFQTAHFINALTVKENLRVPLWLGGKKSDDSRISELLERLQIGHKLNSRIHHLSIGERQRVSIARALIHKPKIIFADEPTSALDDENTEYVVKLLEEQATAEGAALVIVTHDTRLKDLYKNRVEL